MSHDYDDLWQSVYGEMQDMGPTHRHMRRLVQRMLAPLPYRSALEVGCGAGHNLDLLATRGGDVDLVGTDISEVALERAAAAWPGLRTERLDITAERLDERFDLVFCSLVLEHLVEDEAALANMAAMTRGQLVLTTMAGDFERYRPYDEQLGHVRNYRRGELEAKLRAAGMVVRESVYWGFPFFSPVQRVLQNRSRAEATMTTGARIASRVMYALYFLNSSRRGDLLLVRAEPMSSSD
jgi:2-polyprenyl-3-methyl-5-hydroxy-6-metoxy-1,4-benzoquinol methylase